MGHHRRIALAVTSLLLFYALASPAAAFATGAGTASRAQEAGPGAQLGGQATGVTTWTLGLPDCALVQTFDATYSGGSAVGDVVLHIEVCASAVPETVGSFRIDTRVGTLSGVVSGTTVLEPSGVRFEFDLAPTSGTGAFTHIRPALHFASLWTIGSPEGSPFTATIVVV